MQSSRHLKNHLVHDFLTLQNKILKSWNFEYIDLESKSKSKFKFSNAIFKTSKKPFDHDFKSTEFRYHNFKFKDSIGLKFLVDLPNSKP